MRFRVVSAAVNAALAISLLGATGAGAATQAGSSCTGTRATDGYLLFGLATSGPPSAAIPADGVVTSWTFNIIPVPPGQVSQTMKILRPIGPGQLQVIGESGLQPMSSGLNTFATRIPVHAGDLIGVEGFVEGDRESVYCETENAGDRIGVIEGSPAPGSTGKQVGEQSGLQVPVTVSVEPDADNDGFGDETQDACPQSATTQVPCPVVALTGSTKASKKSVTILISSNTPSNVTVNGKVALGKGKKAKLKGGTKGVVPGTPTKFRLKFPAKLIKRLKELPPSKKLTLKVTSTAPNVAAAPTKKVIRVKLKGQWPTS